ncbi:MAG: hypothetical protein ACK5HR_01380 [Mycoplasmatales bacterium]
MKKVKLKQNKYKFVLYSIGLMALLIIGGGQYLNYTKAQALSGNKGK